MRSCGLIGVLLTVAAVAAGETPGGQSDPKATSRARFAERLLAATFKPECRADCDVTMYSTSVYAPQSEQAIRQGVKHIYDLTEEGAAFPQGTPEGQADLEAEIQRVIKEQREMRPRRSFMRVRISGDRERLDSTRVKPDMTFQPDLRIGELPIGETWINADGLSIKVDHDNDLRQASVQPGRSALVTRCRKDFQEWFCVPERLRVIGWLLFCKPGPDRTFTRDPDKIEAFVKQGTLSFYTGVEIVAQNEPGGKPRDRIELTLKFDKKDENLKHHSQDESIRTVLVCDHEDYSQVYELSSYREPGARVISRLLFSQYDDQRIPRHVRVILMKDDQGNLDKDRDITIVRALVNPSIPDDVFAWRPPAGYYVTDRRGAERKSYTADDPATRPGP